jgi:hypothetical protein
MVSKLKRPPTEWEKLSQNQWTNKEMGNWTTQNFFKRNSSSQNTHEKMLTITSHKEMQIKTTLRFHLIPVRIAIIKNTTNRCWQGCGGKGALFHCWWECKLVQSWWKTIWRLPKKLNIYLPYDPAILLLGIYPKEYDSGYSRGNCTPMFIAVLFTIAKLWKQPRCCTTDEWIKKMWYSYTMEFHSAMKKNEILSFVSKWMELENITLCKVSQAQKTKSHVFPHMQTLDLGQRQ